MPLAVLRPPALQERWPAFASRPFPFWLDSAARGRRSLMGSDPFALLVSRGRRSSVWRGGREEILHGDPFETLRALLDEFRRPAGPCSGVAVGAFGYDLGGHLERLPRRAEDDLDFPDLVLGFYDRFDVVDAADGRPWSAVVPGLPESRAISPADYERVFRAPGRPCLRGATFTRERYLAAVERVKAYIAAGDAYQVNLSQRFHARTERDPFDVYLALRRASPAEFGALLQFGRRALLSCSPELFLDVRDGRAVTRPIKGTRRRGTDPDEDARLAAELLASPKDDAELAMIVDLERNDLGRVSVPGGVRVLQPKTLETHPTLHHLSAEIEGRLRPGLGPVDVLRAAFPGGSITGAPKIRAMEIIDELEPTRRAFYTGALGLIGFDGTATLSVAIRTLHQDGPDYTFQAGGGIVADSDPAAEYEETLVKARALAAALGLEPGAP
jgi:para-aminobenzoate synthetase component 1